MASRLTSFLCILSLSLSLSLTYARKVPSEVDSHCLRDGTCPAELTHAVDAAESLIQKTSGAREKAASIHEEDTAQKKHDFSDEEDELDDETTELTAERAVLPSSCYEFLVTDCGLENITETTEMSPKDTKKAFKYCCADLGGHSKSTCKPLSDEVFDEHKGPLTNSLCVTMVSLYETHVAWMEDKLAGRSSETAPDGSASMLDRSVTQKKGKPEPQHRRRDHIRRRRRGFW